MKKQPSLYLQELSGTALFEPETSPAIESLEACAGSNEQAHYRGEVVQPRIDLRREGSRHQRGDEYPADDYDKAQGEVPTTRLARTFVPPTNLMEPTINEVVALVNCQVGC